MSEAYLKELHQMAIDGLDALSPPDRRDAVLRLKQIEEALGLDPTQSPGAVVLETYEPTVLYYIAYPQLDDDFVDLYGPIAGRDVRAQIEALIDKGNEPEEISVHRVKAVESETIDPAQCIVLIQNAATIDDAMTLYPNMAVYEGEMGAGRRRRPTWSHDTYEFDIRIPRVYRWGLTQ